ncbi:MAG: hypothetical protein U1B80_06165 [Anaerolineaceae bacterium]|nr:hypothetical protein [Anaerolineaceae bacterium]
MLKIWVRPGIGLLVVILSVTVLALLSAAGSVQAQIPTVDIPTVTSSPAGIMVTVRGDTGLDQINVRNGPGVLYDKVGIMLVGQQAPAIGRSAGGDWIMIEYPGVPDRKAWVYTKYVNLSPGSLPVIEPPPTPTPLATATIDPTLAAQFIITPLATRLPTYTPPPALVIPTFEPKSPTNLAIGLPMGLVILGLASVGVILGLFTLAQGR